ncbi:MAG: flagellar biosynthetic protein FliO [Rhodospirillaceae bacterium]|nr:flagellar biosynthetic protein FliO [Rhodospirillaceae bacterium]
MDNTTYIRFFLALVIVLGLIFALTWLLKRFGIGQNQMGALGRKKRLRTVESTSLDARHRLVLVRRDNVEHLLVLSPSSATVIESALPAPAEEAAGELPSLAASFKSMLSSSQAQPKDTAP